MTKMFLFTAVWLACFVLSAQAQISLTLSGTGTNTFNALPTLSSGWSTASVAPNSHSNIMTAEQLDLAVQTNSASYVSNALGQSSTVSPAPSMNASARWNTVNQNIQTRVTGNSYTLLMATLHNDTGRELTSILISYDYGSIVANDGSWISEEMPGYMAYYSLSGAPGSWVLIPELSTNGNPQTPITLSATLSLNQAWLPDNPLYLLWADDNAVAGGDTAGQAHEGCYTIDNFSAGVVQGPLTVTLNPTDQTVAQCSSLTFTARATGGTPPYAYQWHKDGFPAPLSNATNSTLVLSNIQVASAGTYIIQVIDSSTTPASQTNASSLIVIPDTNAPVMLSALGDTNLHTITVTFSEPIQLSSATGADFRIRALDGTAELTLTNSVLTNANTVLLQTTEARAMKNYEVVVRGSGINDLCGGLSAADGYAVRLASQIVLIGLSDNTPWNYRADGVDPGTDWMLPGIDVSTWSSNVAVFDGKRSSTRSFITLTNLGFDVPIQTHLPLTSPNYQAGAVPIPTYYFRAHFSFPGDPSQSSISLVTFFDDSGVVFLNGQEAWRLRVTNDLSGQLSFDLYSPIQPNSSDAALEGPFNLPLTNVVNGDNLLAVCLKQVNTNSSDITMGLSLVATVTNFAAVVSSPTLTVTPVDGQKVELSWPESSTGFQLQSNSGLGSSWTQASETDNPSDGYHRVLVTATGTRFFRLQKP